MNREKQKKKTGLRIFDTKNINDVNLAALPIKNCLLKIF